jgi:molybdopterin synthase catalytic subunit
VDEVLRAVADPAAGGICLFVGTVRELDRKRPVTSLEYEAHPTAENALWMAAEKVLAQVPLLGLAALHRVGRLAVGDVATIIAAAAEHRHEAFVGCQRMIDDLKRDVPIWKHQWFGDGTDEWVGAP